MSFEIKKITDEKVNFIPIDNGKKITLDSSVRDKKSRQKLADILTTFFGKSIEADEQKNLQKLLGNNVDKRRLNALEEFKAMFFKKAKESSGVAEHAKRIEVMPPPRTGVFGAFDIAAEKAVEANKIPYLIEQLKSGDADKASEELIEIGEKAVAPLITELNNIRLSKSAMQTQTKADLKESANPFNVSADAESSMEKEEKELMRKLSLAYAIIFTLGSIGAKAKKALPFIFDKLGMHEQLDELIKLVVFEMGKDAAPYVINAMIDSAPETIKVMKEFLTDSIIREDKAEEVVKKNGKKIKVEKEAVASDAEVFYYVAEALKKKGTETKKALIEVLIRVSERASKLEKKFSDDAEITEYLATLRGEIKNEILPHVVNLLKHQDVGLRLNVIKLLTRLSPLNQKYIPDLMRAANDQSWQIRQKAVWLLGEIKVSGQAKTQVLIKRMLNDPKEEVAVSAAEALSKRSVFSDKELAQIVTALDKKTVKVRAYVLKILEHLPAEKLKPIIPALVRVLRNSAERIDSSKEFIDSGSVTENSRENIYLPEYYGEPKLKIPLQSRKTGIFTEEDGNIASKLLLRAGPAALPYILKEVDNISPVTRFRVAFILGNMRHSTESGADALVKLSKDKNPNVREMAVEAMAINPPSEKTAYAIAGCLEDPSKLVRNKAYKALVHFKEQAVKPLVTIIKDQSKSKEVKKTAVEILGKIGKPAYGYLKELLNHSSPEVRQMANSALRAGGYYENAGR